MGASCPSKEPQLRIPGVLELSLELLARAFANTSDYRFIMTMNYDMLLETVSFPTKTKFVIVSRIRCTSKLKARSSSSRPPCC